MNRMSDEKILSDMSACLPTSALSTKVEKNHWRMVDYETEDEVKGVMLFADPELGAPQLELPINTNGLYKIYVGINYTKSRYGTANGLPLPFYGNLEIKLTDDRGFTRIAPEVTSAYPGPSKIGSGKLIARSIQETYWKTADLTGQSLFIRLPSEPYNTLPQNIEIANISYVRLIPLSRDEEEAWRKLQPREDTRRGAFIFCTGVLSGNIDSGPDFHPTSMDWFKNEINPCINTDIKLFVVEAIRGSYCTYRTQIGDVGGKDNLWQEDWIDPLAAFTQLAQENNIKIFASMRMIGGQYPMSYHPISWARFFWQHQEWVKRDRNGLPTTSLSIAYPEVQEYWLSLISEVLDYGINGIVVYLHRFFPFVMYEEPAIQSFKEKFGEDPRELPKNDARWMQHCANYVTDFLRKVRKLVNKKSGRELAVTFLGTKTKLDPDDDWMPIKYNYDVGTWIREGIVDYLFPIQGPNKGLVRKWSEMSMGRVHIWPDIHPRHMPGEEFVKKAREYYEAGADGFCLNDAEQRVSHISEWAVECRLGHREMQNWLEQEARSYYRRVPIKTLMGFATKYSFNNFGDRDAEWEKTHNK